MSLCKIRITCAMSLTLILYSIDVLVTKILTDTRVPRLVCVYQGTQTMMATCIQDGSW